MQMLAVVTGFQDRIAKRRNWFTNSIMDILTLGWVSVLTLFTYSIAMVVWGRHGM